MERSAFGPGKVIVLGEHAVVYGHPALAGAISRGVRAHWAPAESCALELPTNLLPAHRVALERAFERAAKLTKRPPIIVRLESQLSPSMGLGSSGALSVAVARVLLEAGSRDGKIKQRELEAVALEMEKEFHGTPSGVDHTTSARGELLLYQRGRATSVKCPKALRLVIAFAGKRAPTKTTVTSLRDRQARWPQRYRRLFSEIGVVAKEGALAVRAGDLEALGDAMNVNHGLLAALGLSSPLIDEQVHRMRSFGALGAKLTGAGGDGGAVIALCTDPEGVASKLRRLGADCFTSQLAGPGLS